MSIDDLHTAVDALGKAAEHIQKLLDLDQDIARYAPDGFAALGRNMVKSLFDGSMGTQTKRGGRPRQHEQRELPLGDDDQHLLPGETAKPRKRQPEKPPKTADGWNSQRWREEILRYASQHGGRFDNAVYSANDYDPGDHNGVGWGHSRAHQAISHMRQSGLLRHVSHGLSDLTANGRKALAALDGGQTTEREEEPSPARRKVSRRDKNKPGYVDDLEHWARRHGGEIRVVLYQNDRAKRLGKSPRTINGVIYGTIGHMVKRNVLEKVERGIYRLKEQQAAQAPQ